MILFLLAVLAVVLAAGTYTAIRLWDDVYRQDHDLQALILAQQYDDLDADRWRWGR